MTLTRSHLIILAAGASAALLAGAFVFQLLGYAPCKMCIWQRYPHAFAVGFGIMALWLGGRIWIVLGVVAALTTAGIGFFHSGVEQKWWDGPSSCSGGGAGLGGLTGNDLLSTDVIDKVVMCDEISWAFAGLSMPTWNAILSLGIVLLWTLAFRKA